MYNTPSNLSYTKQFALQESADKGGAIMVEGYRQLNDFEVYNKVEVDPKMYKKYILKRLKILVDLAYARDIIDKEIHKFLLPSDPVTPLLYSKM